MPGTYNALRALRKRRLLSPEDYQTLKKAFLFMRRLESRMRIVSNQSTSDLRRDPEKLRSLSRRMGYLDDSVTAGQKLLGDYERLRKEVRSVFDRVLGSERLPNLLGGSRAVRPDEAHDQMFECAKCFVLPLCANHSNATDCSISFSRAQGVIPWGRPSQFVVCSYGRSRIGSDENRLHRRTCFQHLTLHFRECQSPRTGSASANSSETASGPPRSIPGNMPPEPPSAGSVV